MPEAYIFSKRKTPDSAIFFEIDFRSEDPTETTPRLEADERLNGAAVTVDDGTLVIGSGPRSPVFLPGSGPKMLRVWVEGGIAGRRYHVSVSVTTTGSVAKAFPSRSYARVFEVEVVAGVSPGPIGPGNEEGQILSFDGNTYVPKRFAIIPDIDPTGGVNARDEIQRCINVADPGGWVHIPPGAYRIEGGGLEVKPGVTLTGPERGMRGGFRVYPVGYTNVGATFYMYDTSAVLFTMRQQSSIFNCEVYYPNQWAGGAGPVAPTPYNWTFEIGTNDHGCTVGNISSVNPYQFMFVHCDGFKVSDVWAFPLSRGIRLGRCADITRQTNIHFQGATNYDNQVALFNWVRDNGIAYEVDGAEGAEYLNCFAIGYLRGLRFNDLDGDGFRGVSGSWRGGGFDSCRICVRLDGTQMLTARGFRFSDMGFIPYGGDGTGVGIQFADSLTPSQMDHIPFLHLTACSFSGFEHDTGIWMLPSSRGVCIFKGGSMQQFANQGAINQSANARIYMDHVAMPSGETRSVNSGGGTLSDINQITI